MPVDAPSLLADAEVRAWVVIPFDDYRGLRGKPSMPLRVAGLRRKLVEQNITPVTAEDALFGDGEDALFGDGEDALFGA